jgi:hypothetical protein
MVLSAVGFPGAYSTAFTLQAPISVWFRDYEAWSCPNWNAGWNISGGNMNITPAGNANDINPCAGALISSNP